MKYRIIKNICLFLVGFCVYITIEVIFRGYSYWQMGICGGLAISLLDKINDHISWDTDILVQGMLGSALITFFELVIGLASIKENVPRMWDYTNMPFNYRGIVCPEFSAVWFILSLAAVFLADAINYYVFDEAPTPYYRCCGRIFLRFKERKVTRERQDK